MSQNHLQSLSRSPHSAPFFDQYYKAYGNSPTATKESYFKGLGGGRSDPTLSKWWKNEWYPWYQQFIKGGGNIQEIDPTLLDSAVWAAQQLGINFSPWDPIAGGLNAEGSAGLPSSNDFGGILSQTGDYWIYDEQASNIGFVADATPHHVWSYNNDLNVNTTSAKVSYEVTTDGLNPANQVLKVTVKSALGESVYLYHNFQDPEFHLNINVPKSSQVTALADLGNHIKVGKLSSKSNEGAEGAEPESKVAGEEVEPGHFVYDGAVGDKGIEFKPQGNGIDGDVTIHDVFADADIMTRTTDEVEVSKAPQGSDFEYAITIKHNDGSKDVFHVRKAFKTNIIAIKDFVKFVDENGTETVGSVPSGFQEGLTLGTKGSGGTSHTAHPEDTPPTSTESATGFDGNMKSYTYTKANYNDQASVDLHANFEDDIEAHDISALEVTIHASSYADTVNVSYLNGKYYITVYKNGDVNQGEQFIVDASANITIDALPGKVTGDASGDPNIQIGTGPGAQSNQVPENVKNLMTAFGLDPENRTDREKFLSRVYSLFSTQLGSFNSDHNGYLSAVELGKAIDAGVFPPAVPDEKLFQLLYEMDGTLKGLMDTYQKAHNDQTYEAKDTLAPQIVDRVVALLETFYQYSDKSVSAVGGQPGTKEQDNLVFNGTTYDLLLDVEGYKYDSPWQMMGLHTEA